MDSLNDNVTLLSSRPITFLERLKGFHKPKHPEERLSLVQDLLMKWYDISNFYYNDIYQLYERNFFFLILIRWQTLLDEVFRVDYDERNAYMNCICEIMIRPEFLPGDCGDKSFYMHQANYDKLISSTLELVKKKMNNNVVFEDVMRFSANVLAICFFKVPDLTATILCGLNLRPVWIHRLRKEMGDLQRLDDYKVQMKKIFPSHLHPLIGASGWEYQQFIRGLSPNLEDMSSIWMERLKCTSGELYTLFYRHIHVVLAKYLSLICPEAQKERLQARNSMLVASPCYLYVTGYFLFCIEYFIHHMVHSLTLDTANDSSDNLASLLSRKPHYDEDDSYGNYKKNQFGGLTYRGSSGSTNKKKFIKLKSLHEYESGPHGYRRKKKKEVAVSGQQHCGKPQILEELTWKYSECLAWCVMMSEPLGRYHDIPNVMMRALVLSTEIGNAVAVFGIFDFLEAAILQLQHYRLQTCYHPPLDQPFLLHTIQVVLAYSDHSTTLLRVLSFVYAQFKFLASRAGLIDFLCNRILLDTVIFEKLFLHWGANVRNFFLRCLVWRLGCIWRPLIVRWSSEMTELALRNNVPVCDTDICKKSGFIDDWDATGYSDFEITANSFNKMEAQLRQHSKLLVHVVLETLFDSFQQQFHQYEDDQILQEKKLDNWNQHPTAVVSYRLMQSTLTDSPTSLFLELTSNKKMNTEGLVRSNTKTETHVKSTTPTSSDNVFKELISDIRRMSISSSISTTSKKTTTDEGNIINSDDDEEEEDDQYKMDVGLGTPYGDIWYQYYAVPKPLIDPIISTAPIRRHKLLRNRKTTATSSSSSSLDAIHVDQKNNHHESQSIFTTHDSKRLYLLRGDNSGKYGTNWLGKVISDVPNMELRADNTINKAKQWRYNPSKHRYAILQQQASIGVYNEYIRYKKRGIPKLLLDWPAHWVLNETRTDHLI
ncbi:uncharacterized protein BX664DRAFT_326676 [Halteromyces radiatus]|uniref:uncharacterized protein n=1 Tax=Halteromyces radiatus TaxID=101107 RepID=UPI00221FB278|nr:uncharacterized protein BX664DRAFT_326676 [Halteromyces radiatus]KAI8097554.1 hypothetical protein BX664DRAFT_326676 [Halteromyces radiatus]